MPDPIANSDIAAQAFIMAELSPISSFADDSPQAAAAATFYPKALGICLADHDWSFARRLISRTEIDLPDGLAADADLPFTYNLPGDLVEIRHVAPVDMNWRRDENMIRTDQAGGITLRYTRRIEDESKLPDAFQTAVAAQLALLLSARWVKTRTKREDLRSAAAEYLSIARRNDRRSASSDRYDGQARQGDWASEATQ